MRVHNSVRGGKALASRSTCHGRDVRTLPLAFKLPQVFSPALPSEDERSILEFTGLGFLVVPCRCLPVVPLEVLHRLLPRFFAEVLGGGLLVGVGLHLHSERLVVDLFWGHDFFSE